ncbi:sortase [Candidatus Woesebacteria bacterium]|nr:sortase [Candidatus Woesebacteria bacterium]
MALKVYKKHVPQKHKKVVQFFSYVILFVGLCLMLWAYYPLISFEIYAQLFLKRSTKSPIVQTTQASPLKLAEYVYADEQSLDFNANNLRDFTQANVWFPVKSLTIDKKIDLDQYTLSIPKLNLENLTVKVGGEDLSKSLIHYLPTSKPGQYGKVAIFGHSTLPQLYNKSDYKTVFTYLPQLDVGNSVFISSEGKTYEYEVFDMYIVKPDEVSVLEQKFNASYLTLVTCVPPGTFKERMIVEAKLKNKM